MTYVFLIHNTSFQFVLKKSFFTVHLFSIKVYVTVDYTVFEFCLSAGMAPGGGGWGDASPPTGRNFFIYILQ